jgi:pyruvate formate lyase activating enzyme
MTEETTGTIFEIRRFAIHDGPGIRTTVFFKGCPLDCRWCHNPEGRCPEVEDYDLRISNNSRISVSNDGKVRIGRTVTVENTMAEILKDEAFYDQSGGGVTFSGGEPMMQMGFLESLLRSCQDHGLHTTVDTCGYASSDDFIRIYDLVNLFLFDLKIIDCADHIKYTAVPNDLILSNLVLLAKKGANVIIRIPIIPGITDTPANLDAIASFLKPLKSIEQISLLPYNKLGEDKINRYQLNRHRLQLEPPSPTEIEQKAARLRTFGYNVKIGG